MTRRLRHTLALFILSVALLPMSVAANPAGTIDDRDPVAKSTLLRLLNSDSPAEQERALRLIGTYAHTARYDADYFRVLVTPLHGLVATGETEAIRIMAVSALSAIGTEPAMAGLKKQVNALKPKRVERLTRLALAQYEIEQAGSTPTLQKR